MKKKKKETNSDFNDVDNEDSDEYFYYIAGYTSNGTPFGVTWEQAIDDGLVEEKETHDEELPF